MEDVVFQREAERLPDRDGGVNIAVVFGGGTGRAEHALELYNSGLVEYILVSGGIGPYSEDRNIPEAELMAEMLSEFGVPDDHIWIENRSRNTLENVRYSMPIIINESFMHLNTPTRPILVTSRFHLKRTCGLFKKELRKARHEAPMLRSLIKSVYWSASPSRVERRMWKKSTKGCALVAKEFLRIVEYKLLGKM